MSNGEYKYIHFVKIPNPGRKTFKWECRNNSSMDLLGTIEWRSGWRQYVYVTPGIGYFIFSAGCLDDIKDFITRAMDERQAKIKVKKEIDNASN